MAYKPFNQLLHDAVDPPARAAVSKWVQMKWGLEARDNPNKYGVDLIVYRSGAPTGYIEVEVRQPNLYRYETIHVAQRKEKLFQEDLPTLLFVLTGDLSHAWWVRSSEVKNSPLIEVPNTAVAKDEWFYDVPRTLFKYVDLTQSF